jgi:5'-nucleotidase
VLKAGLGPGQIVSINVPALAPGNEPLGIKVVRQCTRPWVDTYEERLNPRGQKYYWNSSVFTLGATDDDTDVAAVRDHYTTITPLQFDLTDHALMRKLESSF